MKYNLPNDLQIKLDKLEKYIKDLGSLAVAFSGGVDSTFLLFVAHEVHGDKAIAVTEAGAAIPGREQNEAKEFCEKNGIRQVVFTVNPFEDEEYRFNGPDRCYVCKRRIFSEIKKIAEANGISYVAEGSNMDDLGDYRPGLRAIEELSIESPLRNAELTKAEIREISKVMGLPTWSKPAYACLATRLVYGEEITPEKLKMIEQAEQFLIDNGFLEERVRMHGDLARIEVPAKDIARLASDDIREAVYNRFKEIGFRFVTLDLHGYKLGSMNETIKKTPGGQHHG